MLKGIQLRNVNRQWWEGTRKKKMLVTHISKRNVVFQVELVLCTIYLRLSISQQICMSHLIIMFAEAKGI